MKKRVCVTGLGVVSSIGIGKDEFWPNLIAGRSGISDISLFDTSEYAVHKGGEVRGFEPEKYMQKGCIKEIGRASQFAIAAAKMALEDASVDTGYIKDRKVAAILGTTMGEGGMIEEIDKHWTVNGEEDVWALTVSKYPGNAISDNVARHLGLRGISLVIPSACSGGNYAIGHGFDMIREGLVDMAIVGGSDPFSRIAFTGFNRLFAMAPDMCRPFDKERKGMMLGEGAGILILEELDAAHKRGASIYSEILGYGLSCDAGHMTAPSVTGIRKVMENAIKNACINKKDVSYISAHGTGTPLNDKAECEAINAVFADSARDISVSSIKSMLGHTMGAASAIEALSCCMAMKESKVPPTINYNTPDPECNIDCVPNRAKNMGLKVVLNNSLAFGGNNACLVMKR